MTTQTFIGWDGGERKRFTMVDGLMLFHLIMIALYYSGAYYFLPIPRNPLLYYLFGAGIITSALCIGHNQAASFFVGFFGLTILLYQLLFYAQVGTPFTGDLIASYPGVFSAGVFALYARHRTIEQCLDVLFISSVVYALLFLFLTFSLDQTQLARAWLVGRGDNPGVFLRHGSDATTGDISFRIRISPLHLVFGLIYAICQRRIRRSLPALAFVLLFAGCIYICGFRTLQGISVVCAVFAWAPLKSARFAHLGLTIIAGTMAVFLCATLLQWNLFELFLEDRTGLVRVEETRLAISALFAINPVLGVGLRNNNTDFERLFGNEFFAPSDIGFYGILFQYGLVGFAAVFALNYFVYRFVRRFIKQRPGTAAARTLALTFLFVATYQIISPYLLEEAGSLLLALALGTSKQLRVPKTGPEVGALVRRRLPHKSAVG